MTKDIIGNLSAFELAILLLLVFVAFYFIHLAIRDYRNARIIRLMSHKIRDLINGRYTDTINEKADIELMELSEQLNDLSDVFRLTHENLAQEKNRLASILAYMTDGVLATNRSGKIIMINETAQKQLNLNREQALEKNITDLLDSDSPYTYRELVSKTPIVTLNRRNDTGEFVSLRLRFALNRRESGFISGLVVVLHDTTEQEKEERERRLFVSNVSHELRTPLTSVKSYLEALDEGALKEDIAPSFIKVSLDETNRMMRMISDLL
ncbi:TPA: PAS domain-containing protein, partial [Streptococcus equi subsp. equi]|nr:PAS domain-containing protein [Streptococcus equi subsp. equi]